MSITAQVLIDNQIRILLHDLDVITWTDAELLTWINDAQREICSYKPDAYVVNAVVAVSAGSRQTLPTGAVTLIDVIRNHDGTNFGRAIRKAPKRVLDMQRPNWHSETPQSEAKVYVFDPRDQKRFYLWPPVLGAPRGVELVYAATPPDIALNAPLLIDAIYAPAVISYVLFRAYSKDADYAADDQRASNHYGHFVNLMTGKEAGERASEPKSKIGRANRTVAEE